jgi:hypothetical protein
MVADRARHVWLDPDRLAAFATELPLEVAQAPTPDSSFMYLGDEAATAAWVVTFSAVNFGSGWFPHVRKLPGRSGSITMMTRLKEHFDQHGALTAPELAAMSPEGCAVLFGQDLRHPVDALLMHFARGLRDLGALLLDHYNGSFTAFIKRAEGSAERLAAATQAMPLFRDIARYQGIDVPFLKRAQLLSADLAVALGGKGLGAFEDLDRLTVFADNLVPHVLRIEGVLRFDPALVAAITREALIPAGSEQEVEIRACAVHAVERMVALLRARGHSINAMGLDYVLWTSGQDQKYKAHPRHRTRTVSY